MAGLFLGWIMGASGIWLLFESAVATTLGASHANRAAHFRGSSTSDASLAALPSVATSEATDAERTPAREESGAPLPSQVAESLAALAHALPSPKLALGTQSLSGHVTDPQGRPLAAVTVRVVREKERRPDAVKRGEGLAALPTLEERLRDAVRAQYEAQADQRETQSDGDGAWRIDGLPDGDWRVVAGKPGFAFTTARDRVHSDAVVDFRATLVVRVPLTVRLPDGATPDEAALVFLGEGGAVVRTEAWRADAPWLALEPGSYEWKATLGDLETGPKWPNFLASPLQHVTVRADAPPAPVVFELAGAPGITGHVKLAAADAQDPVNIRLLLLQSGKEPDVDALCEAGRKARVDPRDGAYAFKDLAAGRYFVGVLRGSSAPLFARAIVDVGDGTVTQDLIVPPLERSACVVAKVLSPDGLPLDQADFRFVDHSDRDNSHDEWSYAAYAVPRGPGLYWIVLPNSGGAAPRRELEASNARFGSKRADFSGPGAEVEIRLGEPATLVVTVPGYVGSGFEGRVGLSVERADADPDGHDAYYDHPEGDPLGADGRQSFGVHEAGPLRVAMSIRADGDGWRREMRVGHLDLVLHPGENQVDFPMPALFTVDVDASVAATSGSVEMHHASGDAWGNDRFASGQANLQLDGQGRVSFAEVPAGEYVLQVWSDGFSGEMKLSVPTAGVVRFDPPVKNCLHVYVQAAAGKLAKAGFETGDKVIAIGGMPLDDVKRDLEAIVAANVTQDETEFTVLRTGQTLTLWFDVKAMVSPEVSGGEFWAATRE